MHGCPMNQSAPASSITAQPSPLPGVRSSQPASPPARRRWIALLIFAFAVFAALVLTWRLLAIELGWAGGAPRPIAASGGNGTASPSGAAPAGHPLDPALKLAQQVQEHLAANVHDYTATVIKQERIATQLKPEEVCFVKVRTQPFSVYMNFLAPVDLKGREAIYVEGANDGMLIGHEGTGPLAWLGSKWLPPNGPLAMMGQRYPITELGIANLTRRLIEVGQRDKEHGECYVWINENAKVGDRPCISITVMHPEKRPGFIFYVARIFVDKKLMELFQYEA